MKICMGADKKHSKFNMRNLFVELNELHYMLMSWKWIGFCAR